jgi:hypothetical protein
MSEHKAKDCPHCDGTEIMGEEYSPIFGSDEFGNSIEVGVQPWPVQCSCDCHDAQPPGGHDKE